MELQDLYNIIHAEFNNVHLGYDKNHKDGDKNHKDGERPIFLTNPRFNHRKFFTLPPIEADQLLALKFVDEADITIPENYCGPGYFLNDNGEALYQMLQNGYEKDPVISNEKIGNTNISLAQLSKLIVKW